VTALHHNLSISIGSHCINLKNFKKAFHFAGKAQKKNQDNFAAKNHFVPKFTSI
jgi:hypothetical protein